MITKAIIEKIISNRSYKVRIPILDKIQSASLSNDSLQTAYVSSQLNNGMNLTVGDIVFIDFEDNSHFSPVILGTLYTSNNLKSNPDIDFNSLEVSNSATLPSDVFIGDDITYENIVCLKNSEKNIQLQLDELLNSLEEYKEKLNKQIEFIDDYTKSIDDIEKESNSLDATISIMCSTIGDIKDNTEETIYGKLNSLSKGIDSLLKSVGTIDENRTFFERVQNINSRLQSLMNQSPIVNTDSSDYEQTIYEEEHQTSNTYSQYQSEKFDSLLKTLRKKFPHGKYWNHMPHKGTGKEYNNQDGYTDIPCTKHNDYCGTSEQTCNGYAPNGSETSWQCMGYAYKCGFDMTGYDPQYEGQGAKWKFTYNVDDLKYLKKGDIIRYKNGGHSIYVIGVDGSYVHYTDCNSDGHCGIKWDSTISKSEIASSFSYIVIAPTDLSKSKLYSS